MVYTTGSQFLYPDRWDACPEADERFRYLDDVMIAICDAVDMTTADTVLRGLVEHCPNEYPLVRPLALAEAMSWCAENIRRLTLARQKNT